MADPNKYQDNTFNLLKDYGLICTEASYKEINLIEFGAVLRFINYDHEKAIEDECILDGIFISINDEGLLILKEPSKSYKERKKPNCKSIDIFLDKINNIVTDFFKSN